MIDHCVSAFLKRKKEQLYRVYITDALKLGFNLNIRFADVIDTEKHVETRTAEEIIDHIKKELAQMGDE